MKTTNTTKIKEIRTDKKELNELLLQYEHLNINEKYNLLGKLSQYYIIDKGFNRKQYSILIKPLFDDIKETIL